MITLALLESGTTSEVGILQTELQTVRPKSAYSKTETAIQLCGRPGPFGVLIRPE